MIPPSEIKNLSSLWKSREELLEWTMFLVWVKNSGVPIEECRKAISSVALRKKEDLAAKELEEKK